MPETLIGADPEFFFFRSQFGGLIPSFDPHAYADYVRAAKNPSVIHAMCEDYRAGAGYDRLLDEQLTRAREEQGEGDLGELLHAGDTWTIG